MDESAPLPAALSPWHSHFAGLARYNVWALSRLYESVDRLREDDYRRDVGLFFKSIHGTLNHLLLAEHSIWYPRFAENVSNRIALDTELETDRAALRTRLLTAAARWSALFATWPSDRFDGTLSYTTTQGSSVALPFASTLAHVFNHATHHRGQVSAAVTLVGGTSPELDMVQMLQAEARAV